MHLNRGQPIGAGIPASGRRDHGRRQQHDLRATREEVGARRKNFIPHGGSTARESPTAGRNRREALHPHRASPQPWRSARTTNAIERLHDECRSSFNSSVTENLDSVRCVHRWQVVIMRRRCRAPRVRRTSGPRAIARFDAGHVVRLRKRGSSRRRTYVSVI